MSFTSTLLLLIILINFVFIVKLISDFKKHSKDFKKNPQNNLLLAILSPIIFLFSSFGLSDFALSTIFYRKFKLVSDKLLPGTLNTQSAIPVAAMALAFISIIQVDHFTLSVCIIAQVMGAYLGPKFVVKFSPKTIRLFIALGLLIATFFIVAGKLNLTPSGGTAIALNTPKLLIAAFFLFIFGALNAIGIGAYAPTMVTLYMLGMNPAVTFPIMMGAATFAVPVGSMHFIKHAQYDRKITLFAATFGLIGVFFGVYFVNRIDLSMLQWFMAIVLLYSGICMLVQEFKIKKQTIILEPNTNI